MDKKLTKKERSWVLYDVGNSAFILLATTIMPIYFNHLAESAGITSSDYLAYWGYAASVSTLIVALLGPVMGTIADTKNFKKKVFFAFIAVGVIGCALLGIISSWIAFLIIYIISKVGFSGSLIFYDSMLSDITTQERMDRISSLGYAWGYIGSCIPFVIGLVAVLGYEKIGISFKTAMLFAFLLVAVWWLVMSVPLLCGYEQIYYVEGKKKHALRQSLSRLIDTLKHAREEKKVFLFLLAFFFYIDGVYTIIDMATAYGAAIGLDSSGLLLALLLTQIVAFPFAILFGRLSEKFETGKLILVCITAYVGIAVFAVFLKYQWQFWMLAVLVGMFQGGIQALSRSYFTKIIPANQSGEYFGLLDICGKGAAFFGTAIVGMVSQVTGDVNRGVGMIAVIFLIGMVLFIKANNIRQ